jgi:hypothetical protein
MSHRALLVILTLAVAALALFWRGYHAEQEAKALRKALAGACEATRTLAPAAWLPTLPASNDPHGLARGRLVAACTALDSEP